MIDIIGAPFDLCGKRLGSRLGPAAIRLAGLEEVLTDLGQEVRDFGDLPFVSKPVVCEGINCAEAALPTIDDLRAAVKRSIENGNLPCVLGGDHSMAIGCVGGALEATGEEMALLWIDAHADLNTPATSPSNNLHGMPIANLIGLPSGVEGAAHRQWNYIMPKVKLQPSHIGFFGIRELDRGEQQHLGALTHSYKATMHEIDSHGIVACMHRFDHWMRSIRATKLWISFDVDALDPVLAPGTGTAVRGGLTYREAHLVAELMRELLDVPECPYDLVGFDVVETNPLFDSHNETAKTAVEWVGSLFGKTILGSNWGLR